MSNLRECVRSAADVVSTTSSTLTMDVVDETSVRSGSDFGDIFAKGPNEAMLRWMASNTVYEFEFEDRIPAITGYQSESDSDLETEMIKALFKRAKVLKKDGDLYGAERKLRNCLTRLSTTASTASPTSLKSAAASGVSRLEVLDLLLDTYCIWESWSKAKEIMTEKLSITEKQFGKNDEVYLWDTLKLAEFMAKSNDTGAAQLQGRRSLRGFKRLGEGGYDGYEQCILFLMSLCNAEEMADEEDAYAALLAAHQTKTKDKPPSVPANKVQSIQASLPSNNDHENSRLLEVQDPSTSTGSLVPGVDSSGKPLEQERGQQRPVMNSMRSLAPKTFSKLLRDPSPNSAPATSSNYNSAAISTAEDITPYAPDVSDSVVQRDTSIMQLVLDATPSKILPRALAELFDLDALPSPGKHQQSLSYEQLSLLVQGIPPEWPVCDESIAGWSEDDRTDHVYDCFNLERANSKAEVFELDALPSLGKHQQSLSYEQLSLLLRGIPLECPVCDENIAGWSEDNRRDHVYDCFNLERANSSNTNSKRSSNGIQESRHRTLHAPTCPVCDQNLSGWSEEMMSTHVNACLDRPANTGKISSIPETWTCKTCMSEVSESLNIDICSTCGSHRPENDSSSLKDVEITGQSRIIPTSSLESRPISREMTRRKVLLIGDACCGKTWLIR